MHTDTQSEHAYIKKHNTISILEAPGHLMLISKDDA